MEKKLNIAYFLDNFYPQINGVVTSSINTAFECARRGHKVCAVVPKTKKMDFDSMPGDYFPFDINSQQGFEAFFYPDFTFTNPFSKKILDKMKEFKPDLIHFHGPFTIGYQAIRIAGILGIPVVGTFHTFFAEPEYLSVIGMQHFRFLIPIGWWYSNMFFNNCDAVVSPGKATAQILLKKKLKSKLRVVSNGVESEKYRNFKHDISKFPFEIKEDDEWVLYFGRVSKEKCLDVLLDAMIIVMSKRKNAKLMIIGNGPYKKGLEKRAKKLNISDRTLFTGAIPNKILLESGVLKHMKVFATPSTSENQPMTILESYIFGLPMVGADAKGIPEMIDGNGFIVPPGKPEIMAEKILAIIEDKKLFEKFSKRALELSAQHDIKLTTDEMEKLYYECFAEYNTEAVN